MAARKTSEAQWLIGKTITAAVAEMEHDRMKHLRLTFSDNTTFVVSYWASYADDASLEIEVSEFS